ncbi:hypothetical protein PHYBLDRAFT_138156 [Phycomyces blakesleeanus NRRL 1555(-)]|uniref:Uncharacterized protein n=1 Tax=Phycomyces blakesleeanus (strain ATCC 8743b / DSM 1359 / FGSC 10004 / NBRC 33097 / NRRL 1555) TaxID=763407 RepID=A0A162V7Q1_PHYB8|nr:hypothetical protein PHYBLDRAFT_138156 [Phycomyces blakesleeanus NRRL 1555(-)]OAD80602.1 hypothetical protein PHYBLDRAFT_138156 [Phycomyces blakesleeanus NRRL 1555(-)]|eukprot:XP_018298642.1 hypothetical protein PHYBLDRAFT_138156 [Phycomyces blakesleeanus NRRL 1555(-)]
MNTTRKDFSWSHGMLNLRNTDPVLQISWVDISKAMFNNNSNRNMKASCSITLEGHDKLQLMFDSDSIDEG